MNTTGGWHGHEDLRNEDTLSGGGTLDPGSHPVLAGRYQVVKRLGEGGMGSVWLAEDQKLDNRKVAIKMLPAILSGKKTAYKQVKAEALMAMKLSHPNIATVRSFEEDEGNPFLVMDCIEGKGLDDILAGRRKLSEEETRKLLGPVAAALDYAHGQGVVHRDVKPGNMMVRKDGVPFVLDFGIAREIQETMTQVTGKLSSGTLMYMSPEQLHGRAPNSAQDVYSFAAMAYECLAGHPPFSRGQIEWQIDHDMPEPLPDGVGEALRKGVMSGLAKDPKDRPTSCAGVLGLDEAEKRERATGWIIFLLIALAVAGIAVSTLRAGKNGESGNARNRAGSAGAATPEKSPPAKQKPARDGWGGACGGDWKTVALPDGKDMRFRWCPAGTFTMGSPETEEGRYDDEVQHQVTLTRGFWMAETEVTQGQWKSLMGTTVADLARKGLQDDTLYPLGGSNQTMRSHWGLKRDDDPMRRCGDLDDDVPVYNVTWCEAKEFCLLLTEKGHTEGWLPEGYSFRLPTEAEWEYACRAETTTALPNGKDIHIVGQNNAPEVDGIAWYGGNSSVGFPGGRAADTESWPEKQYPGGRAFARKVKGKEHNRWGLYDMIGNVYEWCEDESSGYPSGPVTDYVKRSTNTDSTILRVLRGGSWNGNARRCRSADRGWEPAGYCNFTLGFRPVCSAGPANRAGMAVGWENDPRRETAGD